MPPFWQAVGNLIRDPQSPHPSPGVQPAGAVWPGSEPTPHPVWEGLPGLARVRCRTETGRESRHRSQVTFCSTQSTLNASSKPIQESVEGLFCRMLKTSLACRHAPSLPSRT